MKLGGGAAVPVVTLHPSGKPQLAPACGSDGKSFKWIAFRSAATELGQALLASAPDRHWWLAGTIKRDEWNGGNAAEMHLEDAALA